MSEQAEATGRTLEEAKKAAAETLGLSVEECEFEIVEEGSKGLFAKTNFRVRAKASGAKPKPAKEARETKEPREPKPRAERPTKAAVRAPATEPAPSTEASGEEDAVAVAEDGELATAMLNEMFKLGGIQAKADVESLTGKYVNVSIDGKDVASLTENRGAILDSLQYLANAMYSRTRSNGVRLTLDAGAYRSSRATALEKLAMDVATAVLDRQQEAVLDALPAHERRIVHNALQGFEGVETYSEGEEPMRRVVVTPKK